MRQILLDTETTGISPKQGHRILEIGCVEMLERRVTGEHYHQYINPDRHIDQEVIDVHGITNEFVADKPRFGEVVDAFLEFVKGAELIIHNAPFDVGFINHELEMTGRGYGKIEDYCTITDTLTMAREMFPGQRVSLDALCRRYAIDNSHRTLHGALLDSEILADVYLHMTGGQSDLMLSNAPESSDTVEVVSTVNVADVSIKVLTANAEEQAAHQAYLGKMRDEGTCLWK